MLKKLVARATIFAWKNIPLPKIIRKYGTVWTNKIFLVGVQGIIFNEKDEVLLFYHTYRKVPWGIPSGWLGYEQPEEGLKREVFEESGFDVEIEKVAEVSYFSNIYGVKCISIWMVGRYTGGEFSPSPEVSQFQFCPVGQWPDGMREDQKELICKVKSEL